MAIEAQIEQVSTALGQDLDAAADLADEIAALIQTAQAALGQFESQAMSLYNTATDQLGAFVTQIEKHGQIVETAAGNLGSALAKFQSMAEQGQAQCEVDCAAAETGFLATGKAVQTLSNWITTARTDNETLDTQVSADLGQVGDDIQAGGATLTGELGLFDGHVQSLETAIDTFLWDVAQRLGDANIALRDEIHKQLEGELGNVVKSFDTALGLLSNQQAQTAISQIGADAVHEIQKTLTGIIDAAIAGLETTLTAALQKLMDGQGRTDAENKLLEEAMEWLKPMHEGFVEQVRQVDRISTAVDHPL